MAHRAIFMDRDGTIMGDYGHLADPDQVRFLPGVLEGLKRLQMAGFKLIIITSQSGVEQGLLTQEEVEAVHGRIEELAAEEGVFFDGIYYCTHLKGSGSFFRKPQPGMLYQAALEHEIHLGESFMLGNYATDIGAGRRAGCKETVFTGEIVPESLERHGETPDWTAPDFLEAVEYVLREGGKE
jgi:D,D-heptose 1,7-bisphosphate phosphatase